MTQYKYQTNSSLLLEGELGVTGGQLVTKDGSGTVVVVGNPTGSTAVSDLTPNYAEEAMDIATAKTLGTGFVYLNGTSFDSLGGGDYEFEEPDGRVFGLYGRTDGMSQQVYYAGAANNQADLQLTTVPYVPPFLSSSIWQVACVIGGDVFGFTVALRDTTNATLTYRYLYIKHGGSLINTAGHSYIELTPVVANYISTGGLDAGSLPRIVRVGAYYFITAQSWTQGKIWLGGWNAQDTTYPFTTASLASSSPSYTPTTFNIQTNNWPNASGLSTAALFPAVLGSQVTGQTTVDLIRLYNVGTTALSTPVYGNWPLPPTVQWINGAPGYLDGEVDGSGNVFLAFGSQGQCADVNSNSSNFVLVYSLSVAFTAGSAGAYTNAQLTYNAAGTGGTDLLHCQPFPFILGYNTAETKPNEAVNSNAGIPSTCVNKLPLVQDWLAFNSTAGNACGTNINWFYSGYASVARVGTSLLYRGKTPLMSGATLGSAGAAQTNKLATIYPMFNVSPRFDFSSTGTASMSRAKIQPSGILASIYSGMIIAADTVLSAGVDSNGAIKWVVSKLPTNSALSDASYNRGGALVPGMGARVAEYLTNIAAAPNTTLSTMMSVWPVGISNIKNPLSVYLPSLNTSSTRAPNPNSQPIGVGNWTLSGSTYNAPSATTWTTSSSLSTQLATLKTAAYAAALVAYPDRFSNALSCEVIPILNSAGTGVAMALGCLFVADAVGSSGTTVQTYFFTTAASISGGVFSLTNPSSVTMVTRGVYSGLHGIPGTNTASDTCFGRQFHVYLDATNQYLMWTPANGLVVNGDTWTVTMIAQLSGTTVSSSALQLSSISRQFFQCHPQTQGLTWSAQLGVGPPMSDIPISRYTTSAVSTVSDFAASFNQALSAPFNSNGTLNLAELMTLRAIGNNFLLQLGAVNGRLNHKQYNLPSTFLDMTSFAVGTYYLYLTDTGAGGIQMQVDSVQRAETATNMYFGKFDRTSGGFANETSIAECIRFGTARLVSGSAGLAVQGSSIRVGSYVG